MTELTSFSSKCQFVDTLCWLHMCFPLTMRPETLSNTHLICQWIQGSVQETCSLRPDFLWRCIKIAETCGTARFKNKTSTYEQITRVHFWNTICELNPLKIKDLQHLCVCICTPFQQRVKRLPPLCDSWHRSAQISNGSKLHLSDKRLIRLVNHAINMLHKPVQQLLQSPSLAD